MTERRRRETRGDPGQARVTPRDLLILGFVAQAQPVSTTHVQRLLGLSLPMCRRRLRVLRDLQLLVPHVPQLDGPNWFTLGPRAPGHLARVLDRDLEDFLVPRGLREELAHHAMVVELYVALCVATARVSGLTLVEFEFERDIRRRLPDARGALVPDAIAVFGDSLGHRYAVAVEADQGTERPTWLAAHKGLPYADLQAGGHPIRGCTDWRVVCVTPTERRAHRLAAALYDAGVPDGLWYFAHAAQIDDGNVLTPIWRTVRLDASASAARLISATAFPRTVITSGSDGGNGGGGAHRRVDHDSSDGAVDRFAAHGRAR